MRKQKMPTSEWLTWEGDSFPRTFHSDSLVFYVTGHFYLDDDKDLRAELARAIQREGVCSSLGEAYALISSSFVHLGGYYAENLDSDLPIYCDLEDSNYEWDATYVEVPYVF